MAFFCNNETVISLKKKDPNKVMLFLDIPHPCALLVAQLSQEVKIMFAGNPNSLQMKCFNIAYLVLH